MPLPGPPATFGKLIADKTEKWGKVAPWGPSSREQCGSRMEVAFACKPAQVGCWHITSIPGLIERAAIEG